MLALVGPEADGVILNRVTIDALVLVGPLETGCERIAAWFEAGVDTVILEAGAHRCDIQQVSRDLAPNYSISLGIFIVLQLSPS